MKSLFYCLLGLTLISAPGRLSAQTPKDHNGVFVRVYDSDNRKIAKGYIQEIGDEQVTVVLRKKTKSLFVSEVHKLKLKRSFGNTVASGAMIGAGIGLVGAISVDGEDDDFLENVEYFVYPITGFISGGVIGVIGGAFRKPIEIQINGEFENLRKFNEAVSRY